MHVNLYIFFDIKKQKKKRVNFDYTTANVAVGLI